LTNPDVAIARRKTRYGSSGLRLLLLLRRRITVH
jgi:hypothetical protein